MKVKINDKIVDAKLPKAFKKKWVNALRSGKYLQTKRYLFLDSANHGEGGYCCLGVSCRIQHPKLELKHTLWIDGIVAKKAKRVPYILKGNDNSNELVDKLSGMNDSGKWSFKRIASYIEKYL